MPPLQKAIEQNDLPQIRQLLTASPSSIDEVTEPDGIPLALYAAGICSFDILRYIVEYSRASLDLYDHLHRSILHYATSSGDVQKCRYLTEQCGMDPLEADIELQTPYDIAFRKFPDTLYPYYLSVIGTPIEKMYRNPIRRGFYPDPSIVRVGDDYYMVNSSFIYFPCIPVSHSRNLTDWRIIGYAITDPAWSELGSLEGGRGYWAPDISFCEGRFYITATYRYNDSGEIYRRQMVVSSDRPEGPYSRPVFIDEDGIDPSIFHENGHHYMLLNRGARIFELSEDCTKKIPPAVMLYYGTQKHAPEGPHLLKKDGYYYLFQAEGGTGPGHRITVARSQELMGVYEPCPYNPILRQEDPKAALQRCGHGKPVMTQDGSWYMVYLCGRYLEGQYTVLGRETALDPITWTADGWPIVNMRKGPSALQKKPFPDISTPEEEKPWAAWMTPREPEEGAVTFCEDGSVELFSSPAPLCTPASRNLFLHRQESFFFTARAELRLPELKPGQQAGLICYYDENSFAFCHAGCDENGYYCTVTEQIGKNTVRHDPCYLNRKDTDFTFLVKAEELKYTFNISAGNILLYSLVLDHVSYLADEGIRLGKRFTGAMTGTAAQSETGRFTYRLCSFEIHNSEKMISPIL